MDGIAILVLLTTCYCYHMNHTMICISHSIFYTEYFVVYSVLRSTVENKEPLTESGYINRCPTAHRNDLILPVVPLRFIPTLICTSSP